MNDEYKIFNISKLALFIVMIYGFIKIEVFGFVVQPNAISNLVILTCISLYLCFKNICDNIKLKEEIAKNIKND